MPAWFGCLVILTLLPLKFKEHLVRQGAVGGRKAADELRKAVTEKFSYAEETPIEVVAEIVANVSGLSKAMKRDGCLDNEATLYDFVSGFNQAKAPFHFVDLGYSKDAADAKLLCELSWTNPLLLLQLSFCLTEDRLCSFSPA